MAFVERAENPVASDIPTPRSYLPEEERAALFREGGMPYVYRAGSDEAGRAGDEEAAWAWLRFVELAPKTLMGLKKRTSAQFIRDKKLNTIRADQAYGPDWLDRP
jgi:hypothetical protein